MARLCSCTLHPVTFHRHLVRKNRCSAYCAAGWTTNICRACPADVLMASKIMSASPHVALCPCWKRKGQSRPFQYFHAARQTMLRNLERPMPVNIGEFSQPICTNTVHLPSHRGCGTVDVMKVVMVTHGTSRFKLPRKSRSASLGLRIACILEMLGLSKRESRLQFVLGCGTPNGFSCPAVSP